MSTSKELLEKVSLANYNTRKQTNEIHCLTKKKMELSQLAEETEFPQVCSGPKLST